MKRLALALALLALALPAFAGPKAELDGKAPIDRLDAVQALIDKMTAAGVVPDDEIAACPGPEHWGSVPATTNVTAGDTFVVWMSVDPDTSDIAGIQVTFEFHTAHIDYVDSWLSSEAPQTYEITNVNYNLPGPCCDDEDANQDVLIQMSGAALVKATDSVTEPMALLALQFVANSPGTSPFAFKTSECQPTHTSTISLCPLCVVGSSGNEAFYVSSGEVVVAAGSKCPPDCEELKPEPDEIDWSLVKKLYRED